MYSGTIFGLNNFQLVTNIASIQIGDPIELVTANNTIIYYSWDDGEELIYDGQFIAQNPELHSLKIWVINEDGDKLLRTYLLDIDGI